MATVDIAVQAEPVLVLPAVVLAKFAKRNQLMPNLAETWAFHAVPALAEGGSVKCMRLDGQASVDHDAVVQTCALFRVGNAVGPERSSSIKWVYKRASLAGKIFQLLDKTLAELDVHLTLRTYIAGYRLDVADLAVWATLRVNHVALSIVRKTYKNILRWYGYVEYSAPWASEAVAAIITTSTEERSKDKAEASARGGSYDIDLPQKQGPMVTRFPPEPSGYLHIGHAKAALLNDYFARRKPGGTLICRFDDTNPSNESIEFQDAIVNDLELMGIVPDKTSFSSDYFQLIYDYAVQLINDGKAFADDSELGKEDEDRKNRLPSKRRDLDIEETLARFEDMKTGSAEGQHWCLRARIAYDSPNGTLRDPVIYRCNLKSHHRTGTSWRIYPTYDFCAQILDAVEGVTLALRTNEYRDRNAQYEWFQQALGLRKIDIWDFSRVNFVRTLLSKRKLTRIVDQGKVWGWDDPCIPTIRGIVRRGMTVHALREFILKHGSSRNALNLEWGAFWALNKKYIDPICPRHTATVTKDAVRCIVTGVDGPGVAIKPKYHKNTELGTKKVVLDKTIMLEQADAVELVLGEEVTLMNWGNAFVRDITRENEGGPVTEVALELHLQGDVKKTKKLTWLAITADNLVPIDIVSFDHLITKNKLDKWDVLEECLTPETEFRDQTFADCNVSELKAGAVVQFERKGYYVLDGQCSRQGSRMVFFNVPSGRL